MSDTPIAALAAWSNFYVIAGSSAAGLTGLMFVVITLLAGTEALRRTPEGLEAFGTPTVWHFSLALTISAMMCAPWHTIRHVAMFLAVIGLVGFVSLVRVMGRIRVQAAYQTLIEDWIWYSILPLAAYAGITVAAFLLVAGSINTALFILAGGLMSLLLIGIRNAWDIVTFIALNQDGLGAGKTGDPAPPNSSTSTSAR